MARRSRATTITTPLTTRSSLSNDLQTTCNTMTQARLGTDSWQAAAEEGRNHLPPRSLLPAALRGRITGDAPSGSFGEEGGSGRKGGTKGWKKGGGRVMEEEEMQERGEGKNAIERKVKE